jgi:hypothetical protein
MQARIGRAPLRESPVGLVHDLGIGIMAVRLGRQWRLFFPPILTTADSRMVLVDMLSPTVAYVPERTGQMYWL